MTGGFDPAPHAAGVRRDLPCARLGQREAAEEVVGDRAGVLEVAQPGDEREVLPPGQDLVDRRELAGEADRPAYVGSLPRDVEAVDAGGPCIGPEQGGQDLHHRGLAGAVRAEQGDDAAGGHVEVDAAKDLEVAVGLGQVLDEDG